jgi:hypothetical protein
MKKKALWAALAAASMGMGAITSCSKEHGEGYPLKEEAEATDTITFADLALPPQGSWDGSDGSGGFASGIATLDNHYDAAYGSWGGFAYANLHDTAANGYAQSFDVYTVAPHVGGTFAVGYVDTYTPAIPTLHFPRPVALRSADFALNAYAYKSIARGDNGAKKFAEGDWYRISITAYGAANDTTGTLDVYLADFRGGKRTVVSSWTRVDLSPLGAAQRLTFEAASTDVGDWGMNTPAYFCIDNLCYAP